ncbi:NAD(+) diphosphatase [Lichenihabitans sp. Uapishka_5]|uniref:NAD(+) diphosphatase n=1 Tax=Lichenihabitans sp. Uapishka_5 TaxID=3037302 RepID=UPI0029E7D609|nr:NAD(+) diphosphatase [Lichenihabitans sp. Uapishka_5]MDX7949778.1 NAD(+) diphosphatase [Lichenihabitans sp. Uapishka_5]
MTSRPLRFHHAALGFGGNPLDRMAAARDHGSSIPALLEDPETRYVAFSGDHVLVRGPAEADDPWFRSGEVKGFGPPTETVFLGRTARMAVFAKRFDPPSDESEGAPPVRDLRSMATVGLAPPDTLGILAEAKALLHWHRSHRFCAACGQPSRLAAWGWRRECTACGTHHFPRTDPVVIMMAVDGDRCLLGRQPRFAPGMYSCLAGFLEPGETIEAAVRRELNEEAGITVGAVDYLASQPWPFPASLMIGCIAEASSSAITIDATELEDARWFARAELRRMLDGTHPDGLVCPPPMAIAHGLMQAWAEA